MCFDIWPAVLVPETIIWWCGVWEKANFKIFCNLSYLQLHYYTLECEMYTEDITLYADSGNVFEIFLTLFKFEKFKF